MKIGGLSAWRRVDHRCRCGVRLDLFQDLCSSCRSELFDMTRNSRLAKQMASTLYAISIADDASAVIKFGVTDILPKRLKTLQTGSPAILEVLASCHGKPSHEKQVHRALVRHRSHGEWFYRTPETWKLVELMRSGELLAYLGDAQWIKHLQIAPGYR